MLLLQRLMENSSGMNRLKNYFLAGLGEESYVLKKKTG
jgi:hypothetical protein